jgi:predicted NBD/HSP70 family sugar kinase
MHAAVVAPNGQIIRHGRTAFPLAPRQGDPVAPEEFKTRIKHGVEHVLGSDREPAALIADDLPDLSALALHGCVVSLPAPVHPEHGATRLGDLVGSHEDWRDDINVQRELGQTLSDILENQASVHVMSDANAELWGEAQFGLAKRQKNVLLVKISAAIRASMLVNRRIYVSSDGMSGEFSWVHIPRPDDAEKNCACGAEKVHHLHCYASTRVVIDKLLGKEIPGSYNELADELDERASRDEVRTALRGAGRQVAETIWASAAMLDPDQILIASTPRNLSFRHGFRLGLGDNTELVNRVLLASEETQGHLPMTLLGAAHASSLLQVRPNLRDRLNIDVAPGDRVYLHEVQIDQP